LALSNWLTRQEWNAAFFTYLTLVNLENTDDPESAPWPVDLSTHLRVGICVLDRMGYKGWTGITVTNNGDPDSVSKCEDSRYASHACTAEGNNANCLVEIMDGTIDFRGRTRELLLWLGDHPELDGFAALHDICKVIADLPTPGGCAP
jgi:hypothetical protein